MGTKQNAKMVLIITMVGAIAALHYLTQSNQTYHQIVYRELYFLPLILGGFWFGLRGGMITSAGVITLYSPYVILSWHGFSPNDFEKSLELFLFIVVAVLVGTLHDRETARNKEKIEGIKAMAGTVAHELNIPLQVILGNTQLLQDEFDADSGTYVELQRIVDTLRQMDRIIKKISLIDRIDLKVYAGETQILNIDNDRDLE